MPDRYFDEIEIGQVFGKRDVFGLQPAGMLVMPEGRLSLSGLI